MGAWRRHVHSGLGYKQHGLTASRAQRNIRHQETDYLFTKMLSLKRRSGTIIHPPPDDIAYRHRAPGRRPIGSPSVKTR
jgi:hypothetical protein